MLEVREQNVRTLLQVQDLDPYQALGNGGDEVTAESHHAAEIEIYQEPLKIDQSETSVRVT